MEPINISHTDIINATRIMEAALERGTFKANELSGVANLYDKFKAFCDQQEQLAAVSSENQTQVEPTQEDE